MVKYIKNIWGIMEKLIDRYCDCYFVFFDY